MLGEVGEEHAYLVGVRFLGALLEVEGGGEEVSNVSLGEQYEKFAIGGKDDDDDLEFK